MTENGNENEEFETMHRNNINNATTAINEIYQKKIPRIMFRISLCVLIGVIASIAHVFLVASSLGISNIFFSGFSMPAILLVALVINSMIYEDKTKFSSCLATTVLVIVVIETIFFLWGLPVYTNVLVIIASLLCSSVICIAISISAIQQTSKGKSMIKELSRSTIIFLFLTFSLIHCIVAFPVSKLYNYHQIETAEMLVEKFEITQKKDHIEILLPPEYTKHNNYLKSTFSIGWLIDSLSGEPLKNLWSEKSIPCHEGKKEWYIARIPFPKHTEDELILHFKHPWKDYEARTERFCFLKP